MALPHLFGALEECGLHEANRLPGKLVQAPERPLFRWQRDKWWRLDSTCQCSADARGGLERVHVHRRHIPEASRYRRCAA